MPSTEREDAIRRWQKQQWAQEMTDSQLEHVTRVARAYRDHEWGENLRIWEAELGWRRQGPGGPFR